MTPETCCRFCDINLFCPNACKYLRIKWFAGNTIIPSKPCMTCTVSIPCNKYINTQYELSLTVTNPETKESNALTSAGLRVDLKGLHALTLSARLVTPLYLDGEKMANMDKQKSLRTEDYEMPRVVAGEIDESGITFKFDSRETLEGKFGKFSRIIGTRPNAKGVDEQFVIDYSGSKLTKLIDGNIPDLMGHKVKISAYGTKFDRQYRVDILD